MVLLILDVFMKQVGGMVPCSCSLFELGIRKPHQM